MIKIAGVGRKKARRSAHAYEAKNMQGEIMFCGVACSATNSAYGAAQEALVEATIKARNAGFHRVLFLSNSRRLV
uniref:RNase H type-1 domain-containing protein n=1 Tax=Quercus lobata TaxID=97700 RepID=A0A7N2LH70_QUELO